jgi:hypothetical protein
MVDHPNAIPLENGDVLTEESTEVARVWITNNGGSSVWIRAGALEDPRVFGFLMTDTVRHAARAYAGTWGIDEIEALRAIADGFVEELGRQSNAIQTIQEGNRD